MGGLAVARVDPARRRGAPRGALGLAIVGVVAALVGASAAAPGSAPARVSPGTWCGGTRWRLMNLSDPDRLRVNLHPRPISISQMAHLSPPEAFPPRRKTWFERHTWEMKTVLDRYRIASNGEIILILYSITSNTYMNAYMPNPHCLGPHARDRQRMIAARNMFLAHCPAPTAEWQLIGATIEIVGVGFWNPVRTTRGALQNGVELRPVTSFRLIAGCGVG